MIKILNIRLLFFVAIVVIVLGLNVYNVFWN